MPFFVLCNFMLYYTMRYYTILYLTIPVGCGDHPDSKSLCRLVCTCTLYPTLCLLQSFRWAVGLGEQVDPDDPLVTLRLSNRYTATLTSKQLRENAGLGKFPVQASRMKGPRGKCGEIRSDVLQ